MWDHLRKNQMFIHVQSILKHLYIADQYTLLDRDKSATVQPSLGVKQGCPLSPQLFSIYLNDIDSVTDGAQGALTVLLTHGFANHAKQAESLRWKEVSHCQHTEVRGNVPNFNSENLPPLYFDGVLLPYTDSFKYLGMVCGKQINLNTATDARLRPFTAGTFEVKECV